MKVTGPMFSLAATGSLGGVITAANVKGQAVVKKKAATRQAWTHEQRLAYAKISFLRAQWNQLDRYDTGNCRAAWIPYVSDQWPTPFHAFIGWNLERWTDNNRPLPKPSASQNTAFQANGVILSAGPGSIYFQLLNTDASHTWGVQMVLQLNVSFPSVDLKKTFYFAPTNPTAADDIKFTITHLPAGNYWAAWRQLRTGGLLGTYRNWGFELTVT